MYSTKTHTATTICDILITFYQDYNLLKEILSDNSPEFCSNLVSELCSRLDIKHIKSFNYRPQSDGALERSHDKLKEFLAMYCEIEANGDTREWDIFLGHAESAYNKSKHSSTGLTPHQLVFGEKAHLPLASEEEKKNDI